MSQFRKRFDVVVPRDAHNRSKSSSTCSGTANFKILEHFPIRLGSPEDLANEALSSSLTIAEWADASVDAMLSRCFMGASFQLLAAAEELRKQA